MVFIDRDLTEQYKKHNKAMTPKQFTVGMLLLAAFTYFALSNPESYISFYFLIGSFSFLLRSYYRRYQNLKALDQIVAKAHREGLYWDNEVQRFRYNHIMIYG